MNKNTTCALFGHSDTPPSVRPILERAILQQLTDDPFTYFLVGNQGAFDSMAYQVLKKLKLCHPQMSFSVVLAYMPKLKSNFEAIPSEDTIIWEGIETTPPSKAIPRRNDWMIRQCNMVI